jgi:hypothetical protein
VKIPLKNFFVYKSHPQTGNTYLRLLVQTDIFVRWLKSNKILKAKEICQSSDFLAPSCTQKIFLAFVYGLSPRCD